MEVIIFNLSCFLYVVGTILIGYTNKDTITEASMHHIISHTYIVVLTCIGVNLYVEKDYTIPLLIAFIYGTQHVFKENLRLSKTNKWTPDIKDENVL